MTNYIPCSNKEFSFAPDAPVRIPQIQASAKPLSAKLPKGTKIHTRWRKPYQKPDKVGVYQVRAVRETDNAVYYSYWDGEQWSMPSHEAKNFRSKSKDFTFFSQPSVFQDKTWRGLTTAAYLAS